MNSSPGTLGEPDTSGGTEIPERIFWRSDNWMGTTFPAAGVVLLLSLLVVVLPWPDSEISVCHQVHVIPTHTNMLCQHTLI